MNTENAYYDNMADEYIASKDDDETVEIINISETYAPPEIWGRKYREDEENYEKNRILCYALVTDFQ